MLTEESCHFRLSPLVCVLRLGRQLRRSGFKLRSYLSIFSVDTIPRPCYRVASCFTYCYNPGQNSCDINATTGENDAFFLLPPPVPPGSVLTLWLQIFFNTTNIAEGRGDSRNRLFQQHFQACITG